MAIVGSQPVGLTTVILKIIGNSPGNLNSSGLQKNSM
jgi:hypothetical protein